ncbi:MAG: kynureninase [Alphaproteobacteria bacterium]|jgi:kynureninase|nr:kynureninase [Alphaproteobacteria bacterium]
MKYRDDAAFAGEMDAKDPLAKFRTQFHIPQHQGQDCIYFCGNSLGLQPKAVEGAIAQELVDWKNLGVEGHFHGKHPWMPYHEFVAENAAYVVGAKPSEVVMMNGLTANLHLMMVSFYRPTTTRYKILIEYTPFPSDIYAVQSQAKFHGFDPANAIIEMKPRDGEHTLRQEDIEEVIAREGQSIALILIGGVHYYTGQFFDIARITEAGHKQGCMVGFDLAHAAGNVLLKLHDWNVDFACWCSYKYLNSGPGAVAGAFVHERHAKSFDLPRFAGWWGNDKSVRFKMGPQFQPMAGAEGWQLSNPPIFALAPARVSLDIFREAGMENLRSKSTQLTAYLEYLLHSLNLARLKIMTPANQSERGCQLSITVQDNGRKVFDALQKAGVVCDWREPDCIRVAPVPLYNSFNDVYRFAEIFKGAAV